MSNPYQQPNDYQPNPDYPYAPQAPVLAGWPLRVASALIDGIIVGIPYAIVMLAAGKPLAYAVALLGTLVFGAMEGSRGQTPGKMVVGLRTLRLADGRVLGVGMGIARLLLHFLDSLLCCLGYLWPLWDEKRQTFADKIVKSVVIKVQ